MAYYTALISQWATLQANLATSQKLAAINALTVAGPTAQAIVSTYRIYNTIVPSEFKALAASDQQFIRDILGLGTVDVSPGTNARAVIVGAFPSNTATFAALANLAASMQTIISWCQANGYPYSSSGGQLNMNDLAAAGGLT